MRNLLWLTLSLSIAIACTNSNNDDNGSHNNIPDTLRVGTLYSPTSFFLYKGDTMGYDYDRIKNFAKSKNIETEFIIGNNLNSLINLLSDNKIDIIAYDVPITNEYKQLVLNCGSESHTVQVLVQPKSDTMITDVIQLIGKDVFVEKDSKYEARLHNLDEELGGGIKIHPIEEDTISNEDLIEKVANGEITSTVINSDIAVLNQTYFNNIDISLQISFPQRSSWAVNIHNTALADSINSWSKTSANSYANKQMLRRYFELSKTGATDAMLNNRSAILSPDKGIISDYDELFKKHASSNGLDWRFLAAIAWVESQFNHDVVSWAGARGIMQLMPKTAKVYGLTAQNIEDPDLNIGAAAKNLSTLDKMLKKRIINKSERQKFVLAAYNAGIGHILDAISLADKYGKDPNIWSNNVCDALLLKSIPQYYNDEVCKSGYFRGKQTASYVENVTHFYNLYCSKIKY